MVEDRPFYGEFGWAYDALMARPAGGRCAFIADQLSVMGVDVGSRLLDAGCGTGDYAIEFARRGYEVTGIDLSPAMIEEARGKVAVMAPPPTFEVGDLLRIGRDEQFDAILCRGVLNDLTDDPTRGEAFRSFIRTLRGGGALVLDVREWHATARRKAEQPVLEISLRTSRGWLGFRSVTTLDAEKQQLHVVERHQLDGEGTRRVAEHQFVMRCWTVEELRQRLAAAGFRRVRLFGDYAENAIPGATDRLVAVAATR